MSFKLVDNNGSSDVRQYNRKRADEIILDLVPSTEYIVNRSGKFCCKVCPKWPVFDTPAMLKRHRESRKHERSSDEWKRAYLSKELSDSVGEHGGESTAELDSRVLLDCIQSINPGCKPPQQERPMESPNKTMPVSKASITNGEDHKTAKKKKWTPFFQTRHETTLTHAKIIMEESSDTNISIRRAKRENEQGTKEEKSDELYPAKRKKQKHGKSLSKGTLVHPIIEQNNFTNDTLEMKMRYYEKMKQSGWILNSKGKWTKDDDCEFDSDEEPPSFAEIEKWDR